MADTVCRVAGCGRPVTARELCRVHYRSLRAAEKKGERWRPEPIAPRRPEAAHAPKGREHKGDRMYWRGFSIQPEAVAAIEDEAAKRGSSVAAVAVGILEDWAKRRR